MAVTVSLSDRLRQAGFRVTKHRLALLEILAGSKVPLSASRLRSVLGQRLDEATVYRALEAFVGAGLVYRVDFQHGHAHYEFLVPGHHHHHIVCRGCGTVEDVSSCAMNSLERRVLRQSETFASVDAHALEFFGTCRQCVRKSA